MSKIKQIDGNNLVFGLSWTQSSKESLTSAIRTEADRKAQGIFVSRVYKDKEGVNKHQFSLTDNEVLKGGFPAADLLTAIQEDLVYVYGLSEKEAWVCIVHGGEIISGGDTILNKDNFEDDFLSLVSSLDIDLEQFTVYADDNAESFFEGSYEAIVSFNSLIEGQDFKTLSKFKELNTNKSKLPLALAVLVIALGGAYYFSTPEEADVVEKEPRVNIDDMRKKLPKSKDRSIGDLVNQQVGPSKSQMLEDAYQEELSWLNHDFNLNDNYNLLNNVVSFVREQDLHAGGWVIKNYYYDISEPRYHEMVWAKKSFGTALTLKNKLNKKGDYQLRFDDKGSRVSSFSIINSKGSEKRKDILNVMRHSKQDLFVFMHDLDVANVSWFAERTPDSERPLPIAGISNAATAKTRQLKIDSRNFRVSGNGLKDIEKVAEIFKGHDRFLIERLSLDFNQSFNWTIYGVFYEQEIR